MARKLAHRPDIIYLFTVVPRDTRMSIEVGRNEFGIPIGEFRADIVPADRLGHGQKENDNGARAMARVKTARARGDRG